MKIDLFDTSMALLLTFVFALSAYSLIGTRGNVPEIRRRAPQYIQAHGWRIIHYESYQYGSWGNHGGKVWYHVAEANNPSIRYRMYITLWDGELCSVYDAPEVLEHIDVVNK